MKGCPTPGYYGENCSLSCPQNCQEGHCHIEDGTCLRCTYGYKGPTCNEQCNGKSYGQECQQNCGNCKNNEQCHHVNGSCIKGCASGFYGTKCDLICSNNTHGDGCLLKCGNCLYLYGEQCHHVTGQCPRGCDIGYHGDRCDQGFEGLIHPVSESQLSTSLYVCTTFLILSGLLNVILVVRFLRERRKTMRKHQKNLKSESERNKELEHPMPIPECSQYQYENFSLYEELGLSK
uniref:Multiple epidermal growth factor-like domains 10 n=1 Tax=Magallana gigas TaxID=29159 RepID=A0A8W8P1I4_MAGGI